MTSSLDLVVSCMCRCPSQESWDTRRDCWSFGVLQIIWNKSRRKETQQSALRATQLKRCGIDWWAQVAEDGLEKQQRKVACQRVWAGQCREWDSHECQGNMENVIQRVHGMELYRACKVGRESQVRTGKESLGGSDRDCGLLLQRACLMPKKAACCRQKAMRLAAGIKVGMLICWACTASRVLGSPLIFNDCWYCHFWDYNCY